MPEFRLHLVTPDLALWSRPYRRVDGEIGENNENVSDPFWAIFWPGGQALSRFLLDSGVVKGMRVFDLGTGCGAQALAALKVSSPNHKLIYT